MLRQGLDIGLNLNHSRFEDINKTRELVLPDLFHLTCYLLHVRVTSYNSLNSLTRTDKQTTTDL
jgi:hypothetical protein